MTTESWCSAPDEVFSNPAVTPNSHRIKPDPSLTCARPTRSACSFLLLSPTAPSLPPYSSPWTLALVPHTALASASQYPVWSNLPRSFTRVTSSGLCQVSLHQRGCPGHLLAQHTQTQASVTLSLLSVLLELSTIYYTPAC